MILCSSHLAQKIQSQKEKLPLILHLLKLQVSSGSELGWAQGSTGDISKQKHSRSSPRHGELLLPCPCPAGWPCALSLSDPVPVPALLSDPVPRPHHHCTFLTPWLGFRVPRAVSAGRVWGSVKIFQRNKSWSLGCCKDPPTGKDQTGVQHIHQWDGWGVARPGQVPAPHLPDLHQLQSSASPSSESDFRSWALSSLDYSTPLHLNLHWATATFAFLTAFKIQVLNPPLVCLEALQLWVVILVCTRFHKVQRDREMKKNKSSSC